MNKVYKTIIVGGGPAGLTAAIYASRAELQPLVLAGLEPGGQLIWTTEVENYPGFPDGIMGPELMELMRKQAERFGSEVKNETVSKVDFSAKPYQVTTENGTYMADTVIIATGAEANWLNLPNEQRLRGKGVSACATCDGFFFRDKAVAVIGGGDSAMEEASFLTKFASKVYVINRSNEFKASKIMLKRAQSNPKIEFIMNSTVADILGEQTVSGVVVKDNTTGESKTVEVQGYFAAIGRSPATKIFVEAGVKADDKGYIEPQEFTSTNIEGVFVAGDVHDHRYRQAVTAAGEGCRAALDVEKYLAHQEEEEVPKSEGHWNTQQSEA